MVINSNASQRERGERAMNSSRSSNTKICWKRRNTISQLRESKRESFEFQSYCKQQKTDHLSLSLDKKQTHYYSSCRSIFYRKHRNIVCNFLLFLSRCVSASGLDYRFN